MIYIYPIGGLGNTMFHIASIYSLALDNNDELGLLDVNKKINHIINDNRAVTPHADKYFYLFNRFKCFENIKCESLKYPFNYTKLNYLCGHQYVGYFQSENYFIHRRAEVIEKFKPDDSFYGLINKYEKYNNSISLHVRRGDYVKLYPQIHIPQTMDYYNNALCNLPTDKYVLIFSDDINWCKNNFIGDRFIFISEVDYISIYLMAKMKYHVIGNSSFSWWGAWLCENEDKMVIAPSKWFGDNKNKYLNDLLPNNWIRL